MDNNSFSASFLSKPQWKSGAEVAAFLDDFFSMRGWSIEPTTAHQERVLCLGDRRFTKGAQGYFVEYKSGIQTFYTGNVFLETVSVDSQGKAGWVYTCRADYLFYAALLNRKILIFKPDQLRAQIDLLKRQFRETATAKGQNKGYNTHGLLIPLAYAENQLASRIIEVQS